MLKVGITGGIGSGKSVVCQVFTTLGIPVFDADKEAKMLMEHDAEIVKSIKQLMGEDAYENGKLNRSFIATTVFSNQSILQALNKIVHPAVGDYFLKWVSRQTTPYVIKEAALFFETGNHSELDFIIGVYAPKQLRMERAMKRDNLSADAVLARMNNQMDEDEKMKRCDTIIVNDNNTSILTQVLATHQSLIEKNKAAAQ
jgi:dephospho-CoA kinase